MKSLILLDIGYNPALGIFLIIFVVIPSAFILFLAIKCIANYYTPENQQKMLEEDERLGKSVFEWSSNQFGLCIRYKSDYTKVKPDKFELIFVDDIDDFSYKENQGIAKLKCKNGNKYRLYVLDAEKKALATYFASQIEIWKKEIENAPKKELTAEEKKEMINNFTDSLKFDVKPEKDASVIGRAVVGGVIAGPTGAVVGALSAVDKNNKKRK